MILILRFFPKKSIYYGLPMWSILVGMASLWRRNSRMYSLAFTPMDWGMILNGKMKKWQNFGRAGSGIFLPIIQVGDTARSVMILAKAMKTRYWTRYRRR